MRKRDVIPGTRGGSMVWHLLEGLRFRRRRLVHAFASDMLATNPESNGIGDLPLTASLHGLATVQLAINACEAEMQET